MHSIKFLRLKSFFASFVFSCCAFSTEKVPCPAEFAEEYKEKSWQGVFRTKTLKSLDKMLDWSIDTNARSYALKSPTKYNTYTNTSKKLLEFSRSFSYFSELHPLIGTVTDDEEDLILTRCLLEAMHQELKGKEERILSTAEVLAKILAYRAVKAGMEIPIPTVDEKGAPLLTVYVVDAVFDLWHGMPAFGMIDKEGKAAPILLFRGTDVSFISKSGWASVLSDLDVTGPGLTVFLDNRDEIHDWLKKVTIQNKARVIGFSLGGVLGMYAFIHESEFLTQNRWEPSLAFCPPGVSREMYELWEKMPLKGKVPFFVFVNQGDLISKIGRLIGTVREFSLEYLLPPIASHVEIMTGYPCFYVAAVDLIKENSSRIFSSHLGGFIESGSSEFMFDFQ
jgi:hypothetical protein